MDKKSKVSIVLIILIIIAIGGYLVYSYGLDNGDNDKNTVNTVNNSINQVNNVVNNTVENSTVENNIVEPQEIEEPNPTVEENNPNSEISTEDEEEKALSIAKQAWGDDEGVFFSMEGYNQKGDCRIQVTSNAKVLAWYYVNVSEGTYTVEYN